jgi:hypothetical protein
MKVSIKPAKKSINGNNLIEIMFNNGTILNELNNC